MADPRHVAVIDIGKTNAKVAIYDLLAEHEVDRLTRRNDVLNTGLYPHYDVDGLWAFVLSSLQDLGARHRIDAISITTHGASAALLDAEGRLALPILDYEHQGPNAVAMEYEKIRPPFSETGAPRLPLGLNLGAQIFWQQKTFAAAFAKVRWIVTYPQYWAFRLCGVLANEATSLGCHTDLWNVAANQYSSLVDLCGWQRLMPPPRKPNHQLGTLLPHVASATGLAKTTPVFCGIHDSNASLYPHLLAEKAPFAVVSTGTWVISMAIGGQQKPLDPSRDVLVNVNGLGEAVPSARFMGGREYQLLIDQADGNPGPDEVNWVLAKSAMLLPSVVQGCGPFPNRHMQWLNADDASSVQRKIAVSYYLALMTATCLALISAQGPIVVEGPFAEDTAYLAMLASATSRVVLPRTGSTGTTQGTALLCKASFAQKKSDVVSFAPDAKLAAYAAAWRALVEMNAA